MRFKVQFTESRQDFKIQFTESRQDFKVQFDQFQTATKLIGGDPYTGAYDVVPRIAAQTLATKHKVMTDDLTIHEIPYAEVTNLAGGTTATIG